MIPIIPIPILSIEDDEDRLFMAALFESYNRLMYSEIKKVLSDPWEIEDVLQTTLVKLIDKIEKLKSLDDRSLVNYIITASKNNARSLLRRSSRESFASIDGDEELSGMNLSDGLSAEDWVFRLEDIRQLADALNRLDDKSRYLLEAKYILEIDPQEMADELHIKPDSLRMELSRARKRALKLLKDEASEKEKASET